MRPVLLFDVMSTLVHDPFHEEMPAFFGVSFQELLGMLRPGPWVEFELGERTEPEFLDDFFADGRAYDQAGFVEAVRSAYRWLPGMEALVADLRAAGCEVHAFSNYPQWYEMIEERLTLSRFVDWTFVSCLIGLRKPDPAAYGHVLETLGVPAERCIFIDDRGSNCKAAKAAGIDALHFSGAETLRAQLVERGALP